MARYIDVTTLQETLALIPMEDRTFRKAVETIDDAPAADVQPVIHAKWGKEGECPYCGYLSQWEDDNYCAHCGAKMDKENKDGTT